MSPKRVTRRGTNQSQPLPPSIDDNTSKQASDEALENYIEEDPGKMVRIGTLYVSQQRSKGKELVRNICAFLLPFLVVVGLFVFFTNDRNVISRFTAKAANKKPASASASAADEVNDVQGKTDKASKKTSKKDSKKSSKKDAKNNFQKATKKDEINDSESGVKKSVESNVLEAGASDNSADVSADVLSQSSDDSNLTDLESPQRSNDEADLPEALLDDSDLTDSLPTEGVNDAETNDSSLLSDDPLSGDEELPTLDQSLTEDARQDETEEDVENSKQLLARLDLQFLNAKKQDLRDPQILETTFDPLKTQASEALNSVASSLKEEAQALADRISAFEKTLVDNNGLLTALKDFDTASTTSDSTKEYFANNAKLFNANSIPAELNVYSQDFAKVSANAEALRVVDQWNDFVLANGQELERFHVSVQNAEEALNFLKKIDSAAAAPVEVQELKRRQEEWTFQTKHVVSTQRKIILCIETERAQKYWTYAPSSEKVYYLPSTPKEGVNDYVADSNGTIKQVEIPSNAPELSSNESPQITFLKSLSAQARAIPDNLASSDPAKWYEKWCAFLIEIQSAKNLDPIVQYVLFKNCAKILASSDYYFEKRLEPILRMLNAPQLADNVVVDRFQTETPQIQNLRKIANARINFLPKDHLTVNKTSEQLDAQVGRVTFVYRRLGWLDRDFADEWTCRRASETPLPQGDLYVIVFADKKEQTTAARWQKIGESNGKQITLTLASDTIPRGSIVFCRVNLRETAKPVAKRAGIESFFNR